MPFGYTGKILRVDLTTGSLDIEQRDENWYRTYWGGGCLASYYLLTEMAAGVDPLGPDNLLIFSGSVLTGAPLSGFSRYTVAAKSPLTGAFGEAEAGGYFGPELKFSGFDAVVIKGQSAKPVYLWLKDGQAEIRDASGVWGLENGPALAKIREEVNEPKARAATIGPSGENLSLIANVMNQMAHANGRCGLGAVMGSKKLKAVACRGEASDMNYADPDKVKDLAKWQSDRIKEHAPNVNMGKLGTPMFVKALNAGGILPTRNWRSGVFDGADGINADAMAEILVRPGTCYRCAVHCKRVVEVNEPFTVDQTYGGPEYETLAAFGSSCGVSDVKAVAKANEICNRYGLDTIGAGATVAFVMDCFEDGLITAADTDGKEYRFGDAEGMLELLQKIADRDGIGDVLAQGVDRAAKHFGKGTDELAYTIKGQEIPFHDPRGKTAVGLSFALSPTGADHVECPHEVIFGGQGIDLIKMLGVYDLPDPKDLNDAKTAYFRDGQMSWAMNNCLGICNFVVAPLFALTYAKLVETAEAITGWTTSLMELFKVAERSIVLARLFNNREGFGPADDRLFKKLHQPSPEGPNQGKRISHKDLARALEFYFQLQGWDDQGRPSRAKLYNLGLQEFEELGV